MSGLTPEELAYMRETQAEHRPTEAELQRRVTTRSPSGGSVDTWAGGEPVAVRIDGAKDRVPEALANKYGVDAMAKASLDLVHDVRSGDRLRVSATEVYQIVSDGTPDAWATAQIVWMLRVVWPTRAPVVP